MATPSSSATSPSPALSFAVPATTASSDNSTDDINDQERAEREEYRRRILARAELAKITHALRSTLARASYKAKLSASSAPLRNGALDADAQHRTRGGANQAPGLSAGSVFSASPGGDSSRKRKAASTLAGAGYYGSPLAQGFGHELVGVNQSAYAAGAGVLNAETSHMRSPGAADPGPANATKSLFASIFALPPAKRPRTIHNPEQTPVPPPLTPAQQAQSAKNNSKASKKASKKGKEAAESSRGRAANKDGKNRAPKGAKKGREASISSTRTRTSFSGDTEVVNDTDIKAAATLTDILFSRAGLTGSPRSSFAVPTSSSRTAPGSGHTPALSQSSSTSTAAKAVRHARTGSNVSVDSTLTGGPDADYHTHGSDTSKDTRRSLTPLASSSRNAGPSDSQQEPAESRAVDSEAADLMLLLANSPSPARPKAARDRDIAHNVLAAGRVLFPSSGGAPERGRALARGLGGSSFSSVSSRESGEGRADRSNSMSVSPPLSEAKTVPPASRDASPSGVGFAETSSTPMDTRPPAPSLSLGHLLPFAPSLPNSTDPQTPAASFNVHDYINITPSPAVVLPPRHSTEEASASLSSSAQPPQSASALPTGQTSSTAAAGSGSRFRSTVTVSSPLRKSFATDKDNHNLGIGAVGRKLFGDEPEAGGISGVGVGNGVVGEEGGSPNGAGAMGGRSLPMRFGDEAAGSLGSGIDLVQT